MKKIKINKHVFRLIILVMIFLGIRSFADFRYRDLAKLDKMHNDPFNIEVYKTDYEGLKIDHIKEGYLNGFHIVPNNNNKKGIVVVFGGSNGYPDYENALTIAKVGGYEVLDLFYFGMENQNKTYSKTPLEFYKEVESYIDKYASNKSVVTVMGTSKGAELALNLAGIYPSIDNLILIAPSVYNTAGQGKESVSSWTYKNQELPFINQNSTNKMLIAKNIIIPVLTKNPIKYIDFFLEAIEKDQDIDKKLINFKDSKANILIFAGDDDKMWPSAMAAKKIKELAPDRTQINIYKNVGHIMGRPPVVQIGKYRLAFGGDNIENEKSKDFMYAEIFKNLEKWHK